MRLGCESCDLWTAPNMFWTPVRNAVRYEEPPHQLTSCPIETVFRRHARAFPRRHDIDDVSMYEVRLLSRTMPYRVNGLSGTRRSTSTVSTTSAPTRYRPACGPSSWRSTGRMARWASAAFLKEKLIKYASHY